MAMYHSWIRLWTYRIKSGNFILVNKLRSVKRRPTQVYEDIPGSVSEEEVDAVGEEMANPVEENAVTKVDEETANPVNYDAANPVGQVRVQGEVQCPKRKNLDH